ncbi:MAG: hypothetical protein IJV41_07270 [Oscillospiraceae bacterium]|nr:hypothetical protein [Oscillospiraceae bacterium]
MTTEIGASTLKEKKEYKILGAIALVYWLAMFYFERFAFEPGAASQRIMTYIGVKLVSLVCIWLLLLFFVRAVRGWRDGGAAAGTLKYMLPLFVIVTGFWAVSDAYPFGAGDQANILEAARSYSNLGGFFNYLTTLVPMVAMSIFPSGGFAVVFKILLVSMGVGYCIYRMGRVISPRASLLMAAPFLLPPGFYLSYNIHRCPMYAVLYLVYSCLLICDWLEGRKLTRGKFLLLCFMTAALTQWRSEGIYLLILGPFLLYFAYRPALDRRGMALALAVMLAAQVLVYIPQKLESDAGEQSYNRDMPLFQCLITNMERKGLDHEKNAADLAVVDQYLSVDEIHRLNEELGDYMYGDNIIVYYGLRHGASRETEEAFKKAVIRIVLKNPLVYIRTQLGAWSYITTTSYHERKLDAIANIFQNLYVPTAWLLILWIWLLRKKKWTLWLATSGHLIHMAITTALLPASYFKYYYSEYVYAVFSAILVIGLVIRQRRTAKVLL